MPTRRPSQPAAMRCAAWRAVTTLPPTTSMLGKFDCRGSSEASTMFVTARRAREEEEGVGGCGANVGANHHISSVATGVTCQGEHLDVADHVGLKCAVALRSATPAPAKAYAVSKERVGTGATRKTSWDSNLCRVNHDDIDVLRRKRRHAGPIRVPRPHRSAAKQLRQRRTAPRNQAIVSPPSRMKNICA